MKLKNNVFKGDNYITVHLHEGLNQITLMGWYTKPDLKKNGLDEYQIGETIEL